MSRRIALSTTTVWRDSLLIAGASLATALAAQVAIPLPWTPVPVTLQPLAVLLGGALLGPWRGAAAMFLYLMEGAAGLPVFTPVGAPGILRLMGPTGGYLLSYPLAAFALGWMAERGWTRRFASASGVFFLGSLIILFFGGAWMMAALGRTPGEALRLGVLPFLPGDVLKTLFAASLTSWVAVRGKH